MKIIYWLLTRFSLRSLEEWLSWLMDLGAPNWLMWVLMALMVPNVVLMFLPSLLYALPINFNLPESPWFGLIFATLGLFFVQSVYWLIGKVKKIITKGKTLPLIKARWWALLWLLGVILITMSFAKNGYPWIDDYDSEATIWFFGIYFLAGIAVFFYLLLGIKKLVKWRLQKKWLKFSKVTKHKYGLAWRIVLGIFWVWMSIAYLITLNWLLLHDSPMMSTYAVLNAALKNTCFIDPAKENCPHELVELSYIEPEEYQENITEANVQANYHYDDASGFYTFIIRYRPEKAIVFDWRLVEEYGVDFKEVEVDLWSNQVKEQETTLDWAPKEVLVFPEWDWSYWEI